MFRNYFSTSICTLKVWQDVGLNQTNNLVTSVTINKLKLARDPNSYKVDTKIKYRSLNNHNY